jgi:hypothetical protein
MKHKTEDYNLTATKYYLKNKDKLSMKQICNIFECKTCNKFYYKLPRHKN